MENDINNIDAAWDYLYNLLSELNKLTDTVKINKLLVLMETIEKDNLL